MTVSDDVDTPLWAMGSGRPRPRPLPAKCALCQDPPASAFGLCTRCLVAAAAEVARLRPPRSATPATSDDGRPSAVQARDLCRRCGSSGHATAKCPA
jgi:hypothetical protein